MVSAIKHIVCGNLDDPSATFLYGCGQITRGHRIQQMTQFLILFCLIDSCICGTINDTIDGIFANECFNSSLVGDIQFCHIRIKIGMLGIGRLQQLYFISKLAITACNQYSHCYSNFNPSSLSFL